MKIKILIIVIPLLLVLLIQNELLAQGAKSKKPGSTDKNGNERVNTEENVKSDNEPESSKENYEVDHTEEITTDYVKGKPIELYDLIYMLLPDEGASTNNFNFDKLNEIKAVEWQKSDYENGFGIMDVFINGMKEVNEWYISIISNQSNFNIGKGTAAYSFPYDEEQNTALEYLFINNGYSSKALEKKTFEIGAQYYVVYEVKFPSKKTFWLVEEYDSGTRQGSYNLSFYLIKDEVKKELLN